MNNKNNNKFDKKSDCTKIQVVNITSPFDFLISVLEHESCLNLINATIAKDGNNKLDLEKTKLDFNNNALPLVAFLSSNGKWYRAKVIQFKKVFGNQEEVVCYLIDIGEKRSAPINRFKRLINHKLIKFSPLVKRCALYGIEPINDGFTIKNKYEEWVPAATSYFINICKTDSSSLYVKPVETSQNEEINLVKLYLKLKNTTIENDVININKLMVKKNFAKFVSNLDDKTKNLSDINLNLRSDMLKSYFNSDKKNQPNHNNIDENEKNQEKTNNQTNIGRKIETEISQNQIFNNNNTQTILAEKEIELSKLKYHIDNQPISLKQQYHEPNQDIIADGFNDLIPIRKYDENNFHSIIIDYIKKSNQIQITEFQSYCLAAILNGRHVLGLTNQNNNTVRTFLYPLISMILKEKENQEDMKTESGSIKKSIENGPVLLIICTSCKNAQRIFEIITDMLELIARYKITLSKTRHRKYNQEDNLRALLVDGVGEYDVKLSNGCDILISSTPFSILRLIGSYATNLERLKYLVLDEAHILVEKFMRQIKTFMSHYNNLLKVNDKQPIAQLISFTTQWSPKIRSLIDNYFFDRVIISDNKLDSAYFGQTHHIINECTSNTDKITKLLNFINGVSNYNIDSNNNQLNEIKNTIIYANSKETCFFLHDQLVKSNFNNVNCIHQYTQHKDIEKLEKLWNNFNIELISKFNKGRNMNLILIIQDSMLKYINIDCARMIIHFDLAVTKSAFADRIWLMRRHFATPKQIFNQSSIRAIPNSSTFNDLDDLKSDKYSNDAQNDFLNQANNSILENNDIIEDELVSDDSVRICSVILFSSFDSDKYALGSVLKYLKRIGFNENKMPKSYIELANKQILEKEQKKCLKKLCPFIKAYGKCSETAKRTCEYRHIPNNQIDKMEFLNDNFRIPNEGYVRFKISYVEDANFFFINLLGHQNLRKHVIDIDSNVFIQFDMDLQAYYSDPNNIRYCTQLKENEMYIIKDTSSSIYKRVVVTQFLNRDKLMAYQVIVQAIDYGAKYSIPTTELIKIPDRFKNLPPQAVEVYLCNIRPIDCDLNWSTYSKLFIAEKLLKTKEFVGKIQMAAGRSLWLDPINSFSHLKDISLVVVNDSIKLELISNNYGVKYSRHIEDLRNLFIENGVSVSRLEDESLIFEKECIKLYHYMFNLNDEENQKVDIDKLIKLSYLEKKYKNEVQVSAVDTPSRFFVQKTYSHDLLIALNHDFEQFLVKVNDLESKMPILISNYKEDERELIKSLLFYIERMKFVRENFNLKIFEYLKKNSKNIYCFACLHKQNNEHFRAEVIDVYEASNCIKLKVFFVDYGDYEEVVLEDIYPIEEKFLVYLPFQAIECRFDNIKPIFKKNVDDSGNNSLSSSFIDISKQWPAESGDKLWSLTHNQDNFYLCLDAYVNEEIIRNNDESSFKTKCYSIDLKLKNYPIDLDISHLLVDSKLAMFSKEELNRLFNINLDIFKDDITNHFKNDTKSFVEIYFRTGSTKKQSFLIKRLLGIGYSYKCADQNQLLESGMISALAFSLLFVKDKDNLLDIMKFLRKEILSNKSEENLKSFFRNNGIANLISILMDQKSPLFKNEKVFDYIFKILSEVIKQSSFLREELVNLEKYVRSIWMLVDQFINQEKYLNNLIDILNELVVHIERDEQLIYSEKFGKYLNSLINRHNDQVKTNLNDLINKFLKKIEISREDKAEYFEEIEKEENEKFQRCVEFVSSINGNKNFEQILTNDEPYDYLYDITHANYDGLEHSSDEEVFDQMILNLSEMYRVFQNASDRKCQSNLETDQYKRDYLHPKMSWDQTNEVIILKVLLKNVKDMTIDYKPNSVSFRTKLNDVLYGFDLDLFADIVGAECTGIAKSDYVMINLKKKHSAIWIRLLSILNKPKYIKSEYNNLKDISSDEETDGKTKNQIHHGPIDYDSSCNNSDSSSDIDDIVTSDLKESKDIFWD